MSSQADGIPLHHKPDSAGYRLIELTSELESLLESDNAPVLTLESSDTAALLKTPDKTYSLRQKNTSNSIILLSATAPSEGSSLQQPGLTAISTIKETVDLELVPDNPPPSGPLKNTGSKGKWHEKFGKGR